MSNKSNSETGTGDASKTGDLSSDPVSKDVGDGDGELYWPLELANIYAEAAIAEILYAQDQETIWYGGNKPLVDVVGNALKVDAKRAFRHYRTFADEPEPVECLGFMGADREVQARDGVTHFGLVEVNEENRLTRRGRQLILHGTATVRAYLFPADVINDRFHRASTKDGVEGSGRNLYLPIAEAAVYEVAIG